MEHAVKGCSKVAASMQGALDDDVCARTANGISRFAVGGEMLSNGVGREAPWSMSVSVVRLTAAMMQSMSESVCVVKR